MDIQSVLKKLTSGVAVSGKEGDSYKMMASLLAPYGKVHTDALYNVICEVEGNREGHILLDAHLDRIGMIVTGITEDGFLRVAACGGMDRRIVNGQEVTVYGKEEVFGVIASTPPHLQGGDNERKATEMENVLIDIGLSKAKAEEKVSLGDRVTIRSEFLNLLGDCVSSGALDDRAGIAVLLQALELLKGKPHKKITVVCSSREETSEAGARGAAFTAQPEEFIAVDVSFAKTPDSKAEECGILREGAMIGFAPTLSYEMSEELVEIAEQNKIPYQREIMGSGTGTNADSMSVAGGAMKSGLISIPLRYMHTGIEVISTRDIESCGKLIAAYILGGAL